MTVTRCPKAQGINVTDGVFVGAQRAVPLLWNTIANMQQQYTEHQLTREEREALQALQNKRTGLAIFQLSWIMVFVSLVVANLQLRYNAASWPPPGVAALNATVPTVMTVGLIISSVFAGRAARAIKENRGAAFLSQWRMMLLLGIIFVAVMAYEWVTVPVTGQYSDLFRVMVGFHGIHALVIGAMAVIVERRGSAGRYHADHFWTVEATAKLWHFVTIAWLLFYLFLYWI